MKRKSISKKSQTDKARLRALKDEDIDLSALPEVSARQLAGARLRFGLEDVPEGKSAGQYYWTMPLSIISECALVAVAIKH